MLQSANELKNFSIEARDGIAGKAKEFYFDDGNWAVRYLVVETLPRLSGKRVLIAPGLFDVIEPDTKKITVNLSRDDIVRSPSADEHRPVAREREYELNRHYGWPVYWAEGSMVLQPAQVEPDLPSYGGDGHLRSTGILTGFHVSARGEKYGKLDDFIIDDAAWRIRSLAVTTNGFLNRRQVLVCPEELAHINLPDRKIVLTRTKEELDARHEFISLYRETLIPSVACAI